MNENSDKERLFNHYFKWVSANAQQIILYTFYKFHCAICSWVHIIVIPPQTLCSTASLKAGGNNWSTNKCGRSGIFSDGDTIGQDCEDNESFFFTNVKRKRSSTKGRTETIEPYWNQGGRRNWTLYSLRTDEQKAKFVCRTGKEKTWHVSNHGHSVQFVWSFFSSSRTDQISSKPTCKLFF